MKIKRADSFQLFPKKKVKMKRIPLLDHEGDPFLDHRDRPMYGVATEEYWHIFFWEFY